MKLVIDLPDEVVKWFKEKGFIPIGQYLAVDEAMKKAKPLSEVLAENKGEWIPVTERLPLFGKYKFSDDVLITNGYEIYLGYLVERNGKIFWHYYGSDYEYGVKDEDNDAIAWMPLPEPYKEGGEE